GSVFARVLPFRALRRPARRRISSAWESIESGRCEHAQSRRSRSHEVRLATVGSGRLSRWPSRRRASSHSEAMRSSTTEAGAAPIWSWMFARIGSSEEHTSELQSRENLVCRLLLEKKKTKHERT